MKQSKKQVMVAKGMAERGTSAQQLAGHLGVTEGALCYRLKELEGGPRRHGRADQPTALEGYSDVAADGRLPDFGDCSGAQHGGGDAKHSTPGTAHERNHRTEG